MTNKIIITKVGFNALTETNPNNIIFSSDFNTLKYYTLGNTRINGSWTTNPGDSVKTFTSTISHNLGYKPFFICYVDFGSGYNIIPFIQSNLVQGNEVASAWIDNNNIYFDIQLLPGIAPHTWNYDFTFYYKLFKNNTNL